MRRRVRRLRAARSSVAKQEEGDEMEEEFVWRGRRPIYRAPVVTVGINRAHDLRGGCASLRWLQKIRSPREPLCPRQECTRVDLLTDSVLE